MFTILFIFISVMFLAEESLSCVVTPSDRVAIVGETVSFSCNARPNNEQQGTVSRWLLGSYGTWRRTLIYQPPLYGQNGKVNVEQKVADGYFLSNADEDLINVTIQINETQLKHGGKYFCICSRPNSTLGTAALVVHESVSDVKVIPEPPCSREGPCLLGNRLQCVSNGKPKPQMEWHQFNYGNIQSRQAKSVSNSENLTLTDLGLFTFECCASNTIKNITHTEACGFFSVEVFKRNYNDQASKSECESWIGLCIGMIAVWILGASMLCLLFFCYSRIRGARIKANYEAKLSGSTHEDRYEVILEDQIGEALVTTEQQNAENELEDQNSLAGNQEYCELTAENESHDYTKIIPHSDYLEITP